jgi:selenide, water dikinase
LLVILISTQETKEQDTVHLKVFLTFNKFYSKVIRRFGEIKKLNLEITLINEYPFSLYSGMLPGVISQQYTIHQAMRDNKKLIEFAGGKLINSRAISIDWKEKVIICEDTQEESSFFTSNNFETLNEKKLIKVEFDVLVIDVGSVARKNGIEGVDEYTIPTRPISKLIYRIENFEKNYKKDNLKVNVIGGGAAGLEIALCVQSRFKKTLPLVKTQMEILDRNSNFEKGLGSISLAKKIHSALIARKIETKFNCKVMKIEEGSLIMSDDSKISFDLCLYASGSQAPPFIKESGMKIDENGYLLVNSKLQSISHPNVFAAGDCISFEGGPSNECFFIKLVVAKAGVYAVREGPILADNVISYIDHCLEKKNLSLQLYTPQTGFLKILNLGDGTAISDYYGWAIEGWAMWSLKDYIDQKFMNTFPMCLVSKENFQNNKIDKIE